MSKRLPILAAAGLIFLFSAVLRAQNVTPAIAGISPSSVPAGSQSLALTVLGTNFQATSFVAWNGAPLPTAYFGPNELIATVSSNLLTVPSIDIVSVVNSGNAQSNAVTFTVVSSASPLTITTASPLPPATLGAVYSLSLAASGGSPPYSWLAVSPLPAGLTLSSNGSIAGTPTSAGTFSFTVQVLDSSQASTSGAFSITIAMPALSITNSSPLPTAMLGQTYSQALAANGGTPPYQWSGASLPPGLSIDPNSGILSGTPTSAGNFSFTVQVADAAQGVATRTFTLTINAPPLSITTVAPLFTGNVGTPYSQKFSAAGGAPPYSWTILSGSAGGLTLDAGSGTLQGTPQTPGTFTFTVQVSDASGNKASQSFQVVINPPSLTITTGSPLPSGAAGTAYSQTFSVVGGTAPYTWSLVSGSVPGLTFNAAAASLTGTPSIAGAYSFTVQARDANGVTQNKTFSLTINAAPLSITSAAQVPGGVLGAPYTFALAATGGAPPYTWSANGLPAGLQVDPATGVIAGTPTAAGSFSFTVRVVDSTLANAVNLFQLNVALPSAPSATISGLPATVNAAQQVPLQISLSSTFPADITGQAILSFAPNSGAGDATIQFASGGRSASFTVPAGSTNAVSTVPLAIQTGTVAGTITVSLRIQAGGIDVTPTPAPSLSATIAPAAPVIVSATITSSSNGFSVQIIGYSTALEVTQATFTFSPAAGQTLQSTTVTVPTATLFTTWFQNAASTQFGSQFNYTQPFSIQGNAASVIPQSVTLTNRVGSTTANISQ